MEFGGGLDIPITKTIQLRPVEVDYLMTRFGVNGTTYTANQNNFKYSGGQLHLRRQVSIARIAEGSLASPSTGGALFIAPICRVDPVARRGRSGSDW